MFLSMDIGIQLWCVLSPNAKQCSVVHVTALVVLHVLCGFCRLDRREHEVELVLCETKFVSSVVTTVDEFLHLDAGRLTRCVAKL